MDSNSTIGALKVDKRLPELQFNTLLSFLSPEKQQKIKRFFRWQDQHLGLFGDLLSRQMIMESTGCKNHEIRFETEKYGKPILLGFNNLHFNISHSGEWVVCAMGSSEIGVDVELIDDIDLSISESFFHSVEHKDIIGASDSIDRFFDYWTMKESYIKYFGKGLSQKLNSFCIKVKEFPISEIELEGKSVKGVELVQYDFESGYKVAACGHVDTLPSEIDLRSIQDLSNQFLGLM
ncbi:MAG: 4'-phosphopantetheinyl transferase superfamily protein [Flavobacteriales bacterium]|nr:4'-phosphopantetheinyl transferase superfamily protein [Flavobacteriales bacterium]